MAENALDFVKNLGLGWNLGNTFDTFPLEGERDAALAEGRAWTPEDQQSLWFNVPFTKEQAANVAKAGFGTIRIPVTWMDWMDPETNEVDPVWMDAVQQAVDWSLDAGLNVILNVHHDGSRGESPWIRRGMQADPDATLARFRTLWAQIAERFRDYDERLVFEGANELAFEDAEAAGTQYDLLLALAQAFVDTVRASGGNNATRYLLIPGYDTDTDKTCDPRYRLPEDPADDKLIVSIHYYSPAGFALGEHDSDWCEPVDEWGTEAEEDALAADFAKHRERFTKNGIPVILGEYSLLTEDIDHKDHESNMAWLEAVLAASTANGECPVLWDTSTKEMRFLDRRTGEFFDPQVDQIFHRYMA
ncbi:MAG: glycoside hydrolase family 5 protein [Bifidobacterium sp.]|nr:glycoside hydrolase family 5 protein [Bifidobacterium sp.]